MSMQIHISNSGAYGLKELMEDLNHTKAGREIKLMQEQLNQKWLTVDQFKDSAYEGWCWLVYKGRVTEAYHDHKGFFRFNKWSQNCYMTECVSAVMPWCCPEPPTNEVDAGIGTGIRK